MNNKSKSAKETCFVYLWTCVLIYMIEYPLLQNALLTQIIWIPALAFLAYICILNVNGQIYERKEITGVFIVILILGFQILIGDVLFSKQHWIAAFCYIIQLLSVILCSKGTIQKKTFDYIFKIDVILAVVFFIYSISPIAYKVTTHGRIWYTIYYVFNLDNSNIAGIYLFCIFSILLINLNYRKRKLPIAILMTYVMWMIYKTNTRSCILAAIAIVAISIFLSHKKIPKWVIILCMAFPAAFAFIYMYLYNSGINDFKFLGKNIFSGREDVFMGYLSRLQSTFDYIVGNYSANGLQNAHNAPVAIVSSIGIIGFVITYYVFYGSIVRINNSESKLATTCVACLLGVFIQTSAEASMLLGGFPGIVFVDSLFLIANYIPEENDIESKNKIESNMR